MIWPLPPIPASEDVLVVHRPPRGVALRPVVLDSPHSGFRMPPDFGAVLPEAALRDGEDCYIDALYRPAAERGVPLLAAMFPRTYLDPNRHAADHDPAVLAEPWPGEVVASGKAAIGKALVWRTLDDGRPIYAAPLPVAAVQHRITQYHQPYHATLRALMDEAHARFGVVHHINCHSMNAVGGASAQEGAGVPRADIVLGDRDGSTCSPAFTALVREVMQGFGYSVKVNDPFKGVELVRAFADPAHGRHCLQLEINKRLYMDEKTLQKTANFAVLQGQLMQLLDAIHRAFHA